MIKFIIVARWIHLSASPVSCDLISEARPVGEAGLQAHVQLEPGQGGDGKREKDLQAASESANHFLHAQARERTWSDMKSLLLKSVRPYAIARTAVNMTNPTKIRLEDRSQNGGSSSGGVACWRSWPVTRTWSWCSQQCGRGGGQRARALLPS
eukprot:754241-Hanusia_phi.AAC.4